uniref:Uncharacterized protein n=1 Tax=Anguilla anguilla TaxID=7936 RepID=A0A0E9X8R6_ANGAN
MNTAMKMSALLIVVLLGSLERVSSAPVRVSSAPSCCFI